MANNKIKYKKGDKVVLKKRIDHRANLFGILGDGSHLVDRVEDTVNLSYEHQFVWIKLKDGTEKGFYSKIFKLAE